MRECCGAAHGRLEVRALFSIGLAVVYAVSSSVQLVGCGFEGNATPPETGGRAVSPDGPRFCPRPRISLDRFGLRRLSPRAGSVVALLPDWTIAWVNAGWRAFALANGAEEAFDRRFGVGFRYSDAIPPPLTEYYTEAFARCLRDGRVWEHEYECSSPTVYKRWRFRRPCASWPRPPARFPSARQAQCWFRSPGVGRVPSLSLAGWKTRAVGAACDQFEVFLKSYEIGY